MFTSGVNIDSGRRQGEMSGLGRPTRRGGDSTGGGPGGREGGEGNRQGEWESMRAVGDVVRWNS